MGLFSKVYGLFKTSSIYELPKTKEGRLEELIKVSSARKKIEKQINEEEDRIVFENGLESDDDFEQYVNSKDFEKKEQNYSKLLRAHKNLIKKTVLLERDNYNLKKGIYIGLGVNFENLDSFMKQELVYIPWSNWENHAEILGTTRYGKTYLLACISFQMILKGWDIILFDPKGGKKQELLSWMLEFSMEAKREEDIIFFNPSYPKQSSLINPLAGMSNSEIASVISLLSEGDSANSDPFFSNVAYIVTLGIVTSIDFLQSVFDPDNSISKALEKQEIKKYFEILEMNGNVLESYCKVTKIATPDASARMFNNGDVSYSSAFDTKFQYNRSLITFVELAHYIEYNNLKALYEFVSKTPVPSKELYTEAQYIDIIKLKDEATRLLVTITTLGEFYAKISMSLISLLSNLSTGPIGEMFCTVRVNPISTRLKREDKGLIAIIQPAPLKYQKVSDMINKVFTKTFESMFGNISVTGRANKRRVGFLADEAKAFLFPGIEELFNKAGGMGMTIVILLQSSQDRVFKLGDTLAKIVSDNINIHITLKTNNTDSKDDIVRDYGTKSIIRKNTMGTEQGARTMSSVETQFYIDSNSIDKLNKGQAFVSFYGNKFLVSFPFMSPPKGEIIMPRLIEEEYFERVMQQEIAIEKEISVVNSAENKPSSKLSDIVSESEAGNGQ